MKSFVFTADYLKYKRSNRCPKCRKLIFSPKFSSPDGERISAFLLSMNKQALATCPRCGQSWNVYEPVSPATLETGKRATPVLPDRTEILVVEDRRVEVPLGNEFRTIDNLQSSSSTARVVRLTREWSRTCAVDMRSATTIGSTTDLDIHFLDLKATAERTLSTTYSTTTDEKKTFTEEVTLNVAQRTKSEIVFSWKEIRQQGTVQFRTGELEVRVPYEVVVGLTFDQKQIDVS